MSSGEAHGSTTGLTLLAVQRWGAGHFPSRAQRSAPLRLFVEVAKELAVRSV